MVEEAPKILGLTDGMQARRSTTGMKTPKRRWLSNPESRRRKSTESFQVDKNVLTMMKNVVPSGSHCRIASKGYLMWDGWNATERLVV